MNPNTIAFPASLSGIRFVILTDGTVYENSHYECGKRLTQGEYAAIFDHAMTLLCKNIPAGNGTMTKSFKEAGI